MILNLKIGNRQESVELDDTNVISVLEPSSLVQTNSEETIIKEALANPISSPRLSSLVSPGEKIAVVTSDITRPMPSAKVLPFILDELYSAGVKAEDITIVFALGSHRHHSEDEIERLAGPRAFSEVNCVDSDPDAAEYIGTTSRGTPIFIDARVAHADKRICLGNIEYHYFAGYSGGAKAIMPGVATREAIQNNHKLMLSPDAYAGNIDGNPVREDIEESASLVGVDFIFNVILDSHKNIVHAVAGDTTAAHRKGCEFLDRFYKCPIPERADIVLVSQGGAPKDLNLYQTQKALDNSKHAVKDGGTIILVGSCREGFGESTFEKWIKEAETSDSLIERLRNEFVLGGHKAAAIAQVLQKAEIYLVSDMPEEDVHKAFMTPFKTVDEALKCALSKYGRNAKIIAMPYGGSTLPVVETC